MGTMILLFTDFGVEGPYVGQIKAVLAKRLPGQPVVDLMHDAPRFRPIEAGQLLAHLLEDVPVGSSLVCVVDPGVGGARRPLLMEADGRFFSGPDNGLLVEVARAARSLRCHEILWRPKRLSSSFHGRDIFAPALASQIAGKPIKQRQIASDSLVGWDDPADPARIIYIDGFGNLMTGLDDAMMEGVRVLKVGRRKISRARTFDEVQEGAIFWYFNSLGLVEIAVNQGSAAELLGMQVGSGVTLS